MRLHGRKPGPGPETLADLDPRPLRVRMARPPLPGASPRLLRALLLASSGGSVIAAAALMAAWPADAGMASVVWLAAWVLLAAGAAGLTRVPTVWLARSLTGVLVLLSLLLAATAAHLGLGLGSTGVGLLALLVCVLGASVGWRAAAGLAAVALLALAVLAWPALYPFTPGSPAVLGLLLQGLVLAAGWAGGWLLGRELADNQRAGEEREQRFTGLLALAADAHWELNAHYELRSATSHEGAPHRFDARDQLGLQPWDLAPFDCDGDTLDAVQADMDARLPFRDVMFGWTPRQGPRRQYLASGEPRFDEAGIFLGYWGVLRDVTDMVAARQALAATETRYRELFACIPTPLVLHRGGVIIEANQAALGMFGHPDLKSMVGTDLLKAFESGDSRERERQRLELLHEEPIGTALPVADFRLRSNGRVASVRATTVSVETEGGPAMLAIFVDETERLASEDKLRRSESMLAHLVATSPDLITLTDMASGRFSMVNQAFERITGWSAAEAVGRTAADLGVWGDAGAHAQFLRALRLQGSVTDRAMAFVTKAGTKVAMLVSAARFSMDRRDYLVINARDVSTTERARLEREAIFNNAPIGIAVTQDGGFALVNPHFESMFGWPAGELRGQPQDVVWADPQALDQACHSDGSDLSSGQTVDLECKGLRRSGEAFDIRVRASTIDPSRPTGGGTAWIVEDVTERRQFESALARARDDAEAANRAKSAFLANMSHELRTPLNGMIGLARMARAPDTPEERRSQYLDQIADSAQSLASVISDILDLSKIEAGKLQLEATHFDLGELLRTLQQSAAVQAAAHGLALQCELDPAIEGMVQGDPLRVRQIINNYLHNAIKFTRRGKVRLSAQRGFADAAERVRIEVSDTGPGIDKETCERLFEPFTQADQSTTRRYGGTGLGLSICRELATLMGGEVGVHSMPGHGSTFWAVLPLPRAVQAELAADARSAADADNSLVGLRVLMVEDNPVNMMIAVSMLERWGVLVTQAQDGSEAVDEVRLAAANGLPFDAVLMDLQMPVMSGHEATRVLRRQAEGENLPIIALTAAALVSERDEALRAGMNDFLTKPIDAEKLKRALFRWRSLSPRVDRNFKNSV